MTRSLSVAAKAVDLRSRRSTQKKLGASEIGSCRRYAGYRFHGTEPTNPEHAASLPAIVGTWFHKGALAAMAREFGYLIEITVDEDHLRGHVDAIDLPNEWREVMTDSMPWVKVDDDAPDVPVAEDLKTVRDLWMVNYMRNRGPKRQQLYQVHLYALLLRLGMIGSADGKLKVMEQGLWDAMNTLGVTTIPVGRVRLRYIARTGEDRDDVEWVWEQDFDQAIADEAWSWVEQVLASESPESLPRDEDGPGLSVVCDHCIFVTECWGEARSPAPQSQLIVTDADLAATLAEYDQSRTDEREAHDRKALARAKLDDTDPAIYTDGDQIAFKFGRSGGNLLDRKVDQDEVFRLFMQMRELYREANLPVPEVPYLPATHSAISIQVTRWEVPDPPCGKPVGPPKPFIEGEGATEVWLQDRQRGGWTAYAGIEITDIGDADPSYAPGEPTGEELTAGQFAKRFPDYVEPRSTCVLKKGHSGGSEACRDDSFVRQLEVEESDPEIGVLRAVPGS